MATLTHDAAPPVSRRGATALIAAGYAAIAVGADAAAITTDSAGLVIDSVTMPNGAAGLPAYVVRPAAAGRHPAVIVVNEVFGLHEYIKDTCRRLAKAGYVAIAPEFFYRNDPDRKLAQTMDFPFIMKIVGEATNAQVMGDVTTTLGWLQKQGFVAPDRLAITGFCWGGGVTWMAAAQFPQLKAGVAWYGRLAPPKTAAPGAEQRRYPIEVAPDLKAPVLGLYGALDKGIPVDDVAAMQAVLKDAGARNPAAKRSMIRLYMAADHGFHADYRPSYNEADARDGWARMLAHFKANGV
ncbi:dienelactone hydrolase family protein [Sandarakinorhabdus sp. DWP1-3-1]|uniref:dienelactone hydrolase family protein n=1 Tax=Sandarakinorhabdus sp. DWP1-3-1 TaxID=2804627 RepID=UPI003CE74963